MGADLLERYGPSHEQQAWRLGSHTRILPTALAELAAPEHAPGRLKAAATAYRKAIDTLTATTQFAYEPNWTHKTQT